MPGPGKIQIVDNHASALEARIYNFEVGKHHLKIEHKKWLKHYVIPELKQGGSIIITGTTSRTDTDRNNLLLSQRRIVAVHGFLRTELKSDFPYISFPTGESSAKAAGSRDNSEQEIWRGVMVSVWSRPVPPPRPRVPIPAPSPPAPPDIERIVSASFLVSMNMSGDPGDPDSAGTLANMSFNYGNQNNGNFTAKKEDKPITFAPRVILIFPSTTGSYSDPMASIDMLYCDAFYEWGRKTRPFCLLVDHMLKADPHWRGDPTVWKLNEFQTNQWVNNPKDSFFNFRIGLPTISHAAYSSGNY